MKWKTEQNNIGGIIGQETRTAQFSENILEDNLTLGNLYSNSINTNEINRIIGNREDTENNYAYKNQLINGHVTNENLGGKLISYEEIFKESTYTTKMNFENQYDLTELQNEILVVYVLSLKISSYEINLPPKFSFVTCPFIN